MSSDHWKLTGDLSEFLAWGQEFLHTEPARHTVLLTVTENLRTQGVHLYGDQGPLFGVLTGDGGEGGGGAAGGRGTGAEAVVEGGLQVKAALLHTPPYQLNLTRLATDAEAEALVDVLLERGHPAPGVSSDSATADRVVAAWQRRTGKTATLHRRERLYRLGELTAPTPAPPGRPRPATPADRDQLLTWIGEFTTEVGVLGAGPGPALVNARIASGAYTLWEAPDGTPVSVAAVTAVVAGQIRVATVYTPREHRGKGYAGAVTAEASRLAREAPGVQEVLLFTDLANPTSNALYQRLGYRAVEDFTVYDFTE